MTIRSIRSYLAISLLAACGGDDVHHLADAPPSGGSDAPADGPSEGPATLTVTQNGAPVAGVTVHFQNADGSLIETKATDDNGDATAVVRIGAIVTDIDPKAPVPPPPGFGSLPVFDALHTWAGVKPNDHLHLDLVTLQPPQAALTITLPDDAQSHYELFTSCSAGTFDVTPPQVGSAVASNPPVDVTLPVCSAKQDFVVIAQDSDFIARDALVVTDVAVADDTNIDLSAATWTALDATAYTYANVPDGIGQVDVSASLITAKGRVFSANDSAPNDNNAATVTIGMPASQAIAATVSRISQDFADQSIVDWGPLGDVNVDVTGSLLKGFSDVPAYDSTTHAVTWSEGTTGLDADFVRTQISASRTVQADNTIHIWTWDLAAPHAAASTSLPSIPVGDFDFNTGADDGANIGLLAVAKVPNGYDTVRAQIMNGEGPNGLVAGATGHAVFAQLAQREGTMLRRAVNRALTHHQMRKR